MPQSQPRSAQRRQKILAAALECFMQHGVADTTIEMIRKRSGASIGSLYHHYGNKERIASTLYLQGLADFWDAMLERVEASPSARDGIAGMVRGYVDWVSANPDWARFIMQARAEVIRGEAAEELKAANQYYLRRLRSWLKPHVAAGHIRELPPELYRPLIIGPVQDHVRSWLAGRVTAVPSEHAELFVDAAWKAVAGDHVSMTNSNTQ